MLETPTPVQSVTVIDADLAAHLAEIFAALADPNRLRIISALAHHELNVSELCGIVGMSKSAASHQLHLLRTQRIVRARKAGRQVFYLLDDDHIHDLLDRAVAHVQHR
jgi:DNA-binding transcriptional ArsR family regulator